jgi:arsenite methyltransferase
LCPEAAGDHWASWLLERRFGGDPEQLARMLEHLTPVRDRVLGAAGLAPEDVVLDVGAGDGLIGFGALDRLGPDGQVIFSDVSSTLVDRCREIAEAAGQRGRCRFVVADATDLAEIDDASVDVVTLRSVLIYVADKLAAFREFARVLRAGGRVSLFEPINKFNFEHRPPTSFFGYDGTPVADLVTKLMAAYRESGPPVAESPMLNFDERDLLQTVQQAGFRFYRLEYEAVKQPVPPLGGPLRWETFYRSSGNPNESTVEEVVERVLSPDEAAAFEAHFRPLVERGEGTGWWAVAYLRADL